MIDRLTQAGTETQLLALIRGLDRTRFLPFLCLLNGDDAMSRSLEPADCTVVRLGVRSFHHRSALSGAIKLVRFLRRERIAVFQAYFPDSSYFGVPLARLAGVRRIVRTRNNLNHWMTPRHRLLGRLLNPMVSVTIANSEACRQAVLADECPPPESVVVLENGVDLSRFTARSARSAVAGDRRRVGVVANLRPVKGLDVFVQAAARVAQAYPDVLFEIAGEGDQRPELERLARDLGIGDRLLLPGSLADVPRFLDTLDVAVLASRAEGMPNAVLEYMAAGRPIVATAVGGTPQLIEDGVHGLLVAPGDAEAMARAISRILSNPDLASDLGESARLRAETRYSRSAMLERFEEFYAALVGRHADAVALA
jgi:glycosyltransferase involved in cell wall biosynthesis